ncbi:MAG: leucine-rich repeat domain-containing protein [Patescibacteria group bacterium]|jgi:Leucine-rich repeat (LRR) protein
MRNKLILSAASTLIILGVGCAPRSTIFRVPDNSNIGQKPPAIQTYLNTINLSGQNLKTIPVEIFENSRAIELNISNNKLTGAIPSQVGKMTSLKVLNMSNNLLTGIPAEVGQLANLEILDVSNNYITGMPYEIGNLKNLKKFIISGNKYSEQDLAKIRESLPKTTVIETSSTL